jgi:oxygen-independent coproporphyrinogen III oxidase
MAGIYLHIPFCKQKCSYCDFYSNTNVGIAPALIEAEKKELVERKKYLKNEHVKTIYFGGGTPSVLKLRQVEQLLSVIYENFNVLKDAEITFECNPDDLNIEYLVGLKTLGINRVSIGVQSFNDDVLKFLNRRHSAEQAGIVIEASKDAGFDNISIDLMFGIPGMSFESYQESLLKGINAGVQHLSVYQLTFEENTLLYKRLVNKKITEIDEEECIRQFDYTIEKLKEYGFRQYEISNYANQGFESKHNTLYWSNENYLGIGPAAHSYDGGARQWNAADSNKYLKGISNGENYFDVETLTETDKYNEYVLTGLRTARGISAHYVQNTFNQSINAHFLKVVNNIVKDGFMDNSEGFYTLRKNGIFILDFMVRKLYFN